MAVRSTLTTKYFPRVVGEYTKQFKAEYKKENDEAFKGDVVTYMTLGVIQRNQVPDINDVLTLLKLGNKGLDDESLDEKLRNWFEIEGNRERGYLGAFCDLCKDFCIDLPVSVEFTKAVEGLEEQALQMARLRNEMANLTTKFSDILNNIKDEVSTIEEDKAEQIEENK